MKFLTKVKRFFKAIFTEIKKLLSGSDGEWSVRRILGTGAVISGVVLLFVADAPIDGTWQALIWSLRGAIVMLLGFFMFGWVTFQNIKDLAKKE